MNFRELENKLRRLQNYVQLPLDILFLEWWFPSPANEYGHREIPCYEYSGIQKSRMRQTNVDGIYRNFLGAGDRARVITARGARRLLKLHDAYPWGIGEMLPWDIGLYQTGLHRARTNNFTFREGLWTVCEQLSPFEFYAMKPKGIQHTKELFVQQSDVWEDRNRPS